METNSRIFHVVGLIPGHAVHTQRFAQCADHSVGQDHLKYHHHLVKPITGVLGHYLDCYKVIIDQNQDVAGPHSYQLMVESYVTYSSHEIYYN